MRKLLQNILTIMYLYTDSARFDPRTGKPVAPVLLHHHNQFICDMTGVVYDTDEDAGQMRCYEISINYNHDSEPCWYEEYHEFKKEFGIDYGDFSKFMDSPYHFANTEAYGVSDLSEQLMEEWIKARRSKKKTRFSDCHTVEQVFSTLRFEMLRKLLREKKFTLEQLGFVEERRTP